MPRMAQDTTADVDTRGGSRTNKYNYGRTHVGGQVVFRPNWPVHYPFCGWGNGIRIRTRRKVYYPGSGGMAGAPGEVISQWQSWTAAERGHVKAVHALDGNINHPTGEFVVEVMHLVQSNCSGGTCDGCHTHAPGYRGYTLHIPNLRVDWNQP